MATEHAMATMEKAANDRMSAALETISDELGVEIPPVVPERLDPRMAGIRVIERHADILELIADALTAPPAEPEGKESGDTLADAPGSPERDETDEPGIWVADDPLPVPASAKPVKGKGTR